MLNYDEGTLEGATIINVHHYFEKRRVLSILAIVLLGFSMSGTALADSFDDQIRAAQQQLSQQQNSASALRQEANSYQQKVQQYNQQIAVLQSYIRVNQLKSQKVTADIEDAKAKMADQKAVLNRNIKTMYLGSSVTPIEMLASSGNLSDFFDQQQYQDKVKEKIQNALATITKLKADLEKQQQDLAGLISSQQTQQAELSETRAQLAQLQAVAAQNAAAADQQVKATNDRIAELKRQQAAAIQAASRSYNGNIPGASGGSGGACDNGHGNGGYPAIWCNAPQDAYQTPWGYSRECVSWAGWRRQQMNRPVYNWGNANTWDDGARRAGYRVDNTPEVGAVAQTDAGYWGHVAVVEAIQGNNVIVSEMNYDSDGHFRYSTYSASYFRYIH